MVELHSLLRYARLQLDFFVVNGQREINQTKNFYLFPLQLASNSQHQLVIDRLPVVASCKCYYFFHVR